MTGGGVTDGDVTDGSVTGGGVTDGSVTGGGVTGGDVTGGGGNRAPLRARAAGGRRRPRHGGGRGRGADFKHARERFAAKRAWEGGAEK